MGPHPGGLALSTMSSPNLTVVGSVNADLVVRCDRLPQAGETVLAETATQTHGGKGANQALAAARAGGDVSLIGCVGDDAAGREALAALERGGVDVTGVRVGRRETGRAYVFVAREGENQIVVTPGANGELTAADAQAADGRDVLCQLEVADEVVEASARLARRFFLNAAPARPLPAAARERAELVVVNASEARALDGLLDRGRVVVTLGGDGAALYEDGRELLRVAAPRVPVVDVTGAGDAFAGTLVVALLAGEPIEDALRRACGAGAEAVGRLGAQLGSAA